MESAGGEDGEVGGDTRQWGEGLRDGVRGGGRGERKEAS